MSDEIENTPSPEDNQPEPTPESEESSGEQPVEEQADTEESSASEPEGSDESEPSEEASSDDEAAALAAAMAAINQVQGVADSASNEPAVSSSAADQANAEPFEAPVLDGVAPGGSKNEIDLLSDVHMDVRIELGRTKMFVEDVLKLGEGAVVELDKLAGDPVDVFVNNRKVARGEVLVLNDLFCVRLSEIVDISATDD